MDPWSSAIGSPPPAKRRLRFDSQADSPLYSETSDDDVPSFQLVPTVVDTRRIYDVYTRAVFLPAEYYSVGIRPIVRFAVNWRFFIAIVRDHRPGGSGDFVKLPDHQLRLLLQGETVTVDETNVFSGDGFQVRYHCPYIGAMPPRKDDWIPKLALNPRSFTRDETRAYRLVFRAFVDPLVDHLLADPSCLYQPWLADDDLARSALLKSAVGALPWRTGVDLRVGGITDFRRRITDRYLKFEGVSHIFYDKTPLLKRVLQTRSRILAAHALGRFDPVLDRPFDFSEILRSLSASIRVQAIKWTEKLAKRMIAQLDFEGWVYLTYAWLRLVYTLDIYPVEHKRDCVVFVTPYGKCVYPSYLIEPCPARWREFNTELPLRQYPVSQDQLDSIRFRINAGDALITNPSALTGTSRRALEDYSFAKRTDRPLYAYYDTPF